MSGSLGPDLIPELERATAAEKVAAVKRHMLDEAKTIKAARAEVSGWTHASASPAPRKK